MTLADHIAQIMADGRERTTGDVIVRLRQRGVAASEAEVVDALAELLNRRALIGRTILDGRRHTRTWISVCVRSAAPRKSRDELAEDRRNAALDMVQRTPAGISGLAIAARLKAPVKLIRRDMEKLESMGLVRALWRSPVDKSLVWQATMPAEAKSTAGLVPGGQSRRTAAREVRA